MAAGVGAEAAARPGSTGSLVSEIWKVIDESGVPLGTPRPNCTVGARLVRSEVDPNCRKRFCTCHEKVTPSVLV